MTVLTSNTQVGYSGTIELSAMIRPEPRNELQMLRPNSGHVIRS
jgi:hypothetical protein